MPKPFTYRTAEQWLFTLITDPEGKRYFIPKTREQVMTELEEQLTRTRDFLTFAGNPEAKYKSIHVAGTSGKGSVTAMLAAVLSVAGVNGGYHVSPYLQTATEKLVANGEQCSQDLFAALVGELRDLHEAWVPGSGYEQIKYGEGWVALTHLFMAHQQVDWAVIEAGLGGRFDPTNILPSKLSIISNIDYDHINILGETLEEIAWHKAGIIKPGTWAVTGERKPVPLAAIEQEAQEQSAQLFRIGHEYEYVLEEDGSLTLRAPYHTYAGIRLNLQGKFQPDNAAVAVAALDVLREHEGLAVDEAAVREGLGQVWFPGRMEVMQEEPFVMIDGAHNAAKMSGLVESFQAAYPGVRPVVVCGIIATKDGAGMARELTKIASQWVATQPEVFGKPAVPADELAEIIHEVDAAAEMIVMPDWRQAVEHALETGQPVLITGSIYLIGAARGLWHPV